MSRVTKVVSTLAGGVSQQPPSVRRATQVEDAVNAWLSLVGGATKRPPTEHLGKLIDDLPSNASFTTIDRDGEDYAVIFSDRGPTPTTPGLRVFGIPTGTEATVVDQGLVGPLGYSTHYLSDCPDNFIGDWRHIGTEGAWSTDTGVDEATAATSAEPAPDVPNGSGDTAVELARQGTGDGNWTHQAGGRIGQGVTVLSVYVKKKDDVGTIRLLARNTTQSLNYQAEFTWSGTTLVASALAGTMPGTSFVESVGGDWYRAVYVIDQTNGSNNPNPGDQLGFVRLTLISATTNADYFWGIALQHDDTSSTLTESIPLRTAAYGSFRFLTVADATFVLNTEWTARYAGAASESRTAWLARHPDTPTDVMYVSVQQGVSNADYVVEITNTAGTFSTTTNPGTTVSQVNTQWIAGDLATDITALDASLSATAEGSVIEIKSTSEITSFSVTDSQGDTLIAGWRDEVERFADLPLVGRDGYRTKVSPDPTSTDDDFWVECGAEGGTEECDQGPGNEATDWETVLTMDEHSMTHQPQRVIDDASGTVTGTAYLPFFTFGPVDWVERTVGSTDPAPGSAGKKLGEILFHANRLGLAGGQNLLLSEAGVYFNLFNTTTLTVPESDPIDLAVNEQELTTIRSAGELGGRLIVSTDNGQYELDGDIISPNVSSLRRVSSYSVSPVRPSPSGRSLLYLTRGADYVGAVEFFRNQEGLLDFEEVSQGIPSYIAGTPVSNEALPREQAHFILADSANTLYVYRNVWSGNRRVQAAWSRWVFGDDAEIVWVEARDRDLIFLIVRDNDLYLEKMEVGDGIFDDGQELVVHIDRRVRDTSVTSEVYDAPNDKTVITLPYTLDSGATPRVATTAGVEYNVEEFTTTTVTVTGDCTSDDYWVGEEYNLQLTLTEPVIQVDYGEGPVPRAGRLLVDRLEIRVAGTGFLSVLLTPACFGETFQHDFTSQASDLCAVASSTVDLFTGSWITSIASPADGLVVKLESPTVLPTRVLGLTWEGDLSRYRPAL